MRKIEYKTLYLHNLQDTGVSLSKPILMRDVFNLKNKFRAIHRVLLNYNLFSQLKIYTKIRKFLKNE